MALQEGNRTPIGIHEFGDRERFDYIPHREISSTLERFGIDSTQHRIAGLYIRSDGLQSVGVGAVDLSMTQGHFLPVVVEGDKRPRDVMRGIEQVAAMYQTALARAFYAGELTATDTPHLGAVGNVVFENMIVPAHVYNIGVQAASTHPYTARSVIFTGERPITFGSLEIHTSPYEIVTGGTVVDLSPDGNSYRTEQVREILTGVGYGEEKMRVDEAAVEGDIVTVRLSLGEHGYAGYKHDGVPFLSEGEIAEAAAQALVVGGILTSKIKLGMTPLFRGIPSATFYRGVGFPSDLRLQVAMGEGDGFRGDANVFCGDKRVAQAIIEGSMIREGGIDTLMRLRRRQQPNETPRFPFQG